MGGRKLQDTPRTGWSNSPNNIWRNNHLEIVGAGPRACPVRAYVCWWSTTRAGAGACPYDVSLLGGFPYTRGEQAAYNRHMSTELAYANKRNSTDLDAQLAPGEKVLWRDKPVR